MNKGTYTDSTNNLKIVRQLTNANFNHNPRTVTFPTSFTSIPRLIAKPSTMRGANPCNLRVTGLGTTAFAGIMREEYSSDKEVNHVVEGVGYFAIGN